MSIHLKGRLLPSEIGTGQKPFYYDLPPTCELLVICGCGKTECNKHLEHGKRWECIWELKADCRKVIVATERRVEFWEYMKMIVEHSISHMEYKCDILKNSKMAKNIDKNLKMWKALQREVKKQNSLQGRSISCQEHDME